MECESQSEHTKSGKHEPSQHGRPPQASRARGEGKGNRVKGGSSNIKIVYICHPFGGDPAGNAERVRRICEALKRDCVPLAPQLMLPGFIDEARERDLAIHHCLRLVAVADEVRVYGEVSEGMQLEIAEAKRLGKPIVFVEDRKRDDPQVKLEAVRG